MNPALRAAATGMMAQQLRTEVISNNLANVNTTAFKRSRAHFEDLLYQTVQGATTVGGEQAATMPAIQVGRGVRLNAVQRLHAQGAIEATSRELDLAIEGDGFFQLQMPGGEVAYSRDGSLTISDQGTLVNAGGYTVLPGIRIPMDAGMLNISRTGIVTMADAATGASIELGRIELARFPNPSGLLSMGENIYQQTDASGAPVMGFPQEDGFGRLLQGHLEGSNVEIVQEMVDMITSMRAYEVSSKAIKNAEQMSEMAANMVR